MENKKTKIISIASIIALAITLITVTHAGNQYNTRDKLYERNVSITLDTPTKEGYTFLGWTGSNGSTPETSVTIAANTTCDLHYIANWQAN